jgi:transposase
MNYTRLREITEEEKNRLYNMMDGDQEAGYRAEIVLLRSEGYTVPEIRRMTNHHDNNIRKWIHRFDERGIEGIRSKRNDHRPPLKVTGEVEEEIVRIASTNPRQLGLKFSTWSLRVLAGYLMEKKIVSSISHAEVRNVLLKHGIEWRHSKTVLSKSRDPQYDLKKAHRRAEKQQHTSRFRTLVPG